MSIIINVEQSPLTITPSNGEHIWTLSSSASTLSNFKYIIDVYFRPSSVVWSGTSEDNLKARLKVRPNEYGKAIIELEEIVRTFLQANPRFSGETYPYLNYVAQENSVITLSDAQNTRTYNAYNLWPGGSPNSDLEQLWQVEQYRVILGCEYTTGNTTNSTGMVVQDLDRTASWQPNPINIFMGVDNTLIPEPYLEGATLGSGYTQSPNFFQVNNQGWYYYDLFRHIYQTGADSVCGPREFLNAAGRDYQTISQSDVVTQKVRRRKHHPDCPIIMTFLDGENDYFNNQNQSLVVRGALTKSNPYTYSAYTLNNSTIINPADIFKMGVFYLPYNVTANNTLNAIPPHSEKLCFYLTEDANDLSFSARTTEIMEFYIQDRSCINNPIHFLFLNGRGMWDTYTFGGKSQKTITADRKKYQSESSLNKQFYSRGSSQRGQVVYETNADYKWKAKSWFMDENDVVIVEELFMSPEVYIITGTTIPPEQCAGCLDEIRLYQYLIPVVIEDKDFVVYEKQYQKIYQYEFTLAYGSVKRFRTQG